MPRFFMFGKYSVDAVQSISPDRTEQAVRLIQQYGGTVENMYVLLGEKDLVLIVDLPGVKEAMKVSIEMTKLTGIGFVTAPAIPVADFDKIFG